MLLECGMEQKAENLASSNSLIKAIKITKNRSSFIKMLHVVSLQSHENEFIWEYIFYFLRINCACNDQ